ncbi:MULTISPECIES: ribbon-helix-helix protein, CopG family [Chelatococcus]|uniref:ribbon-helix-helix protein, CopG family n=1 Tax=Chelatococcus TaxID=28209 RepID=UPI00224BC2B1|nr:MULTISPECIES: ribbon-helix-helix protein, CopG family [Chelatococcus]MBX3584964.1 ribbon-helix-helix protein, CopG family [Rhizobiaceae bacterium]CAH1696666.1 Ribbon-helix-helix protein, copG family [Hyphomicrobiales bacterium]MBX3540292.1 ribbon-helix-helix protein, CopG family [Chelatococcus sp.]CAH1657048.1 Ribbon-helix-helix protein, copG family [Chelatococcus asaccharovorans]CAH1695152.1 Ribbon-helix-helix protein, copG family [Chelatococcus asaccharovorans]
MKSNAAEIRRKVAAHRARQLAAGRIALTTYVPTDLLAQIDKIKEQRGVPGRAPIIEEALRFYIEKQQGA